MAMSNDNADAPADELDEFLSYYRDEYWPFYVAVFVMKDNIRREVHWIFHPHLEGVLTVFSLKIKQGDIVLHRLHDERSSLAEQQQEIIDAFTAELLAATTKECHPVLKIAIDAAMTVTQAQLPLSMTAEQYFAKIISV